ncbi:uncharacterized protein METZ01_LOCUS132116 [marine metagenome]|uniref:Uncharacterized protein n=1 Tax=marine metagenome TaxID=408172 RepID=A0A381YRL2_9ZZZZ
MQSHKFHERLIEDHQLGLWGFLASRAYYSFLPQVGPTVDGDDVADGGL